MDSGLNFVKFSITMGVKINIDTFVNASERCKNVNFRFGSEFVSNYSHVLSVCFDCLHVSNALFVF